MIDLYTVPLGATARDFFSAEAENKYSYDEALDRKRCWCFQADCL